MPYSDRLDRVHDELLTLMAEVPPESGLYDELQKVGSRLQMIADQLDHGMWGD